MSVPRAGRQIRCTACALARGALPALALSGLLAAASDASEPGGRGAGGGEAPGGGAPAPAAARPTAGGAAAGGGPAPAASAGGVGGARSDARPAAPPERSPTARQRARALLKQGLDSYREADFAVALAHFERAHALYPTPSLLLNIGTTLRYLGRNAEAARRYRAYLRHPQADPEQAAGLRRILREIALVTGTLLVLTPDERTRIEVDGQPVGSGRRVRWRVDPGRHAVVAHPPGAAAAVKTVSVDAGQQAMVELRAPSSPAGRARLAVVRERASIQPVVGLAVGATGLVGLALGGLFGGLALSATHNGRSHCDTGASPWICDDVGQTLLNQAQLRATASTVSLVAGGVATAAGVVLLLTAPDGPVRSEVSTESARRGAGLMPLIRW